MCIAYYGGQRKSEDQGPGIKEGEMWKSCL